MADPVRKLFKNIIKKFNIKIKFLFFQGLGSKKVVPIVRQNTVQNQSPLMQSLSTAMLSESMLVLEVIVVLVWLVLLYIVVVLVWLVLLYIVECIKARQERKKAKMNLKMQMRIMTMAHLLYCIMMNTLIIGWVRIFLFLRSIGVTLEKLRSLAGRMSRWIIKSSSWSGYPLLRK